MSTAPNPGFGFGVFTAPAKPFVSSTPTPAGEAPGWDPITSTLIWGPTEAVLVDCLCTVAEATALADWVALHGRTLTTIYVTHGHFDHFYGLSVLLDRFPEAKAVATPQSVEVMRNQTSPWSVERYRDRWPGQIAERLPVAEPLTGTTLEVDGEPLHVIAQGQTDTIHTTSLHAPVLDLVVGGDVLYNQCHMFVGGSTADSRVNWLGALDRLAALRPTTAVAGHKKEGAPDLPSAIDDSRRYLTDFSELTDKGLPDTAVFAEMTARYPDWVSNQWWLMFGGDPAQQAAQ